MNTRAKTKAATRVQEGKRGGKHCLDPGWTLRTRTWAGPFSGPWLDPLSGPGSDPFSGSGSDPFLDPGRTLVRTRAGAFQTRVGPALAPRRLLAPHCCGELRLLLLLRVVASCVSRSDERKGIRHYRRATSGSVVVCAWSEGTRNGLHWLGCSSSGVQVLRT